MIARRVGFFLLGVVFGWLLIRACGGPMQEEVERRQYCEMVDLYRQDPTTGWPDYRGIYGDQCQPRKDPTE